MNFVSPKNVLEKFLTSHLDQFYSEILPYYTLAYRRHYISETTLMRLTETRSEV